MYARNLNYWDSVASLAGEIRRPAKIIPKAFGWALVMVILTYLLPVLVSVGVMGSSTVNDGYFVDVGHQVRTKQLSSAYIALFMIQVGKYNSFCFWDTTSRLWIPHVLTFCIGLQVGGPVMAGLIMISAAASQVGLFESEMSSDAFLIEGMSERGFLPRWMGIKSRFGTPTVGILLSSMGVVMMVLSFDFEDVVDMLNYSYCMSMVLEFAAFIYLRIYAPNASRPFR